MLFILKKWVGGLLMPLPFFLIIFFIALILLFFTQKQKVARLLLVCSFTFLFLLSMMPVAERMAHQIERKHLPISQKNIEQDFDYILLLGAGGIADPSLPVNSQLSEIAINRFLEALRLYHYNPNAILIVSGASFGDLKSHAQMQQELAIIMGIPRNKIIRLDANLDSDDEAAKMSEIIRGKRSVLVTSATHMDRALNLFYQYGTAPMAAPTNFIARNRNGATPHYYYIPSAHQLKNTTIVWHEYLGMLQSGLKQLF